MKAYSKYKKSRIEWVGEIPEEWAVHRLKFSAFVNPPKQRVLRDKRKEVSFLPMESVSVEGDYDKDSVAQYGDVSSGYTYFGNKDVLVAKITPCFENGKGTIVDDLVNQMGFGTTEFHVLRSLAHVNPEYLFYFSRTHMFRIIGEAFMQGAAGQKRITTDFTKSFPMTNPPIDEQIQIARVLRAKLNEINLVIDEDKKLIELLKEKRIALIDHAVTKGLDPNIKLKDSGVDWIGQVPATWVVKKLKFVARIKTGDKNTEDQQPEGKYPFFVRSQTVERLNTFTFNGEAVLTAGDGVGVGKVFHYYNGKFDYHQRVYGITNFKEVLGKYAFYYLKNNLIKEMLKYNAKSTVDSLRLPMFLNFVMTFPVDVDEQKEIIEFLDKETSKIDRTINKIEEKINLLEEYKKSLIHHVVFGKVDVRGVAA